MSRGYGRPLTMLTSISIDAQKLPASIVNLASVYDIPIAVGEIGKVKFVG
jgi:hypothetical protein